MTRVAHLILPLTVAACAVHASSAPESAVDITDAVLTLRSADCADYAADYYAVATDLERDMLFDAVFLVEDAGDVCVLSSNSIPNHDFNDAGTFATPVAEVDASYEVPANPSPAGSPTALSLQLDNAVFLNGVKLDLLAAACYGVGNEPLGREKIGCFQDGKPWRYDPMHPGKNFGTDAHNAHTQPDGSYHYHGSPNALFDHANASVESPVIGFAADGYPIFGPYIDDAGTVRKVQPGWTLRSGARASLAGEGAFPGGTYDGTFVDDYEFTGQGDLDACNGMTRDGVYGYYVTDSYPWVIGCFTGTPDASFTKGR